MSKEANQPALEYWMLNVIIDALQKEYDRYKKQSGISGQLSMTAKNKGFAFAKECEKEIQENKYHPLGHIFLSKRRIEEIREHISQASFEQLNQKQP